MVAWSEEIMKLIDRHTDLAVRVSREPVSKTALREFTVIRSREDILNRMSSEIDQQALVISELVEALQWMIDQDETNEADVPMPEHMGQTWDEINAYRIAGLNRASSALSKARSTTPREE